MQNRTVLPEFIGIITPFRFEIQALAENVGKDGKANPNTMSNKRSSILGIIEDWVNNDYIEYKKEGDNKDSPNILKINFGEFRKYVMEAFNDVRRSKTEKSNTNLNNRSNHAIDIKAASLISWAKIRLSSLPTASSQYQEVAIALMILTGRRQSEIMSSAKFEAIENRNNVVMFSGQLKRHNGENVAAYEIPILGNAAREVIEGIQWLQDNSKRVVCLDDSYESQQIAAKKAHDRFSRYLSEVAKKIISDYVVVGSPDDWELADESGKKKDRRKCHLFRQIYGQCVFPVFFEDSGRKLNQILTEVMGHSNSLSSRKHAAENYDSDCFVKDIDAIKSICS
ncbi:MAG: protelomerase family protein [Cuspidothrix sp.]